MTVPNPIKEIALTPAPLPTALNTFTCDLYRAIAETNTDPLVLSPYSISTAFAMVYIGARGNTATEIAHVFHYPKDVADLFQHLAETLRVDPALLTVANALWLNIGTDFLADYLATLQTAFNATPHLTDFVHSPMKAVAEINTWVRTQTRDKIDHILKELDELTRLVLVNVIVFKGLWQYPFDEAHTRNQSFIPLTGEPTTVPMMARRGNYGYAKGEGWQAVMIPYEDGRLAMMALLPDSSAFATIEADLTPDTLNALPQWTRPTDIILELPRWKTESTIELPKILQKMGVQAAFSDQSADLSGINGGMDLYVSDARHRAVIEVNEAGTEASAATAVVITTRSMMPTPEPLRVTFDHPFLYWIYDHATGVVLFVGRYVG